MVTLKTKIKLIIIELETMSNLFEFSRLHEQKIILHGHAELSLGTQGSSLPCPTLLLALLCA